MEKMFSQLSDVVGAAKKGKHARLLAPKDFLQQAADEVDRANRYDRPLAVGMIVVDGLIMLRKAQGQAAANTIMSAVIARVYDMLRVPDRVGRLGPGELGLLMPETSLKNAGAVVERLRSGVDEAKHDLNGVTLSIGVAALTARVRDPKQFLMTGCFELRRAQSTGGNTVSLATPDSISISIPRSGQIH